MLARQPRVALGHWPTSLHPLERLSKELGGPTIWLKRDDCTGLATGGNKTRKLEFLLGEAQQEGAHNVITFGAVQSNHARQTAAACAKLGLACHLLLVKQVPSTDPRYEIGGNLILDRLFGAHVHLFEMDDRDGLKTTFNQIKESAPTYVIPGGGSNSTGALGYVAAMLEIAQQGGQLDIEFGHVLHASSSAGTQAGLLAGARAMGLETKILGINVSHPDPADLIANVTRLTAETQDRFELATAIDIPVTVNHAYLGDGYGIMTPEGKAAIHMLGEMEGILFDPVYSGKALAALIDQVNIGGLKGCDHVLLIHTGGIPALHVYESELNKS